MDQKNIRNFSIIAHIDHGKSTIADALLSFTKTLDDRQKKEQFLDNMDIERERGITIKAQTVRLGYKALDGIEYQINLIDTPGHVDFAYEVSRSLKACEGALLVVDAAQGVEAQTVANVYLAADQNLEILPVLNKIDLPAADVEGVKKQVEEVLGIPAKDAVLASAKDGIGIQEILEEVVKSVPPPQGDREAPLKALIFDSWFDPYQGVVILCRIVDGTLSKGDRILMMHQGGEYEVLDLGIYAPFQMSLKTLSSGEVGYVICGLKDIRNVKVGDTITHVKSGKFRQAEVVLDGFKKVQPVVFCGIFPVETTEYKILSASIEKLSLNDSSFTYEVETSDALGFGFRCGFLGLLHMEIVKERLEREFDLSLIVTAPSVVYRLKTVDGSEFEIENPSSLPDPNYVEAIYEPMCTVNLYTPTDYLGRVIQLCEEKRGIQESMNYLTPTQVQLQYKLPYAEMVFDFYDRLKSMTKGYASVDYQMCGDQESKMVRLDILLNGERVDALSLILHTSKADALGRSIVKKLKDLIPRQQYLIAIQAAIGSKILSRETLGALRKDVTAKCYGGDISRKRKLLEKQKEGKKKMKQIGKVALSQDAFLAVLKVGDE